MTTSNHKVGDRVEVVKGHYNPRFNKRVGKQGEILLVWPLIQAMNIKFDDGEELVFLWGEVEKVDNG